MFTVLLMRVSSSYLPRLIEADKRGKYMVSVDTNDLCVVIPGGYIKFNSSIDDQQPRLDNIITPDGLVIICDSEYNTYRNLRGPDSKIDLVEFKPGLIAFSVDVGNIYVGTKQDYFVISTHEFDHTIITASDYTATPDIDDNSVYSYAQTLWVTGAAPNFNTLPTGEFVVNVPDMRLYVNTTNGPRVAYGEYVKLE